MLIGLVGRYEIKHMCSLLDRSKKFHCTFMSYIVSSFLVFKLVNRTETRINNLVIRLLYRSCTVCVSGVKSTASFVILTMHWLLLRSCHINTSSFCFFLFSASCQDMIFRQTVAFTQTS